MSRDIGRRHFLRSGFLGAAAVTISAPGAAEHARAQEGVAVSIGADRQLFLDDRLLDLARTTDVTRVLNPPQAVRRVLKPDQPWEALGFIFYCSVVDDNGTAKLFHGSYDGEKKKHFGVAVSRDGLHWERPTLGLRSFRGGKDNNLLPLGAIEASVFLDPRAPAEKRYRLLFTWRWPDPERAGVFVASSCDGTSWSVAPERLLPFVPDSQPSGFWDERLRKYVIYLRTWNPGRAVARVEVEDLERPWPYDHSVPPLHIWGEEKIPTLSRELPTVMARDDRDPENLQLYTSAAVRYPFAPDVYLAFPAAYMLFSGPDWKGRALNSNDGIFEVQLATSRDGVAWNRWRQPYVAPGYQDGIELRLVSMGQGMVRRGRLLYQYFVGWPHTHGRPVRWDTDLEDRAEWLKRDLGGIYCATQRIDGFVSMDAAYTGGTLVTRPLIFDGDRLRLNIHTAGTGHARVALLAENGDPIEGLSESDCEIISADALDHEVCWKKGPDIGGHAGKPVRIRVTMRNAKLFAMQFGRGSIKNDNAH